MIDPFVGIPWKLIGWCSLALAFAAMFAALKIEKAQNGKLKVQLERTVESYRAAQREAELRNKAQVQKIEAQHEAITDRVKSDYARDLERLRAQANRGSPRGPGVSGVPKAPGGADEADPMRLSPEELLRAQELELQLKYLIEWVERQAGVETIGYQGEK